MSHRRARGFTITELLVTLVLVSIFAFAAVPGFQALARNGARAAALNELASALRYARAEAARLRRQVIVCATANPAAAEPVCANAGRSVNYGGGYIVFSDDDRDGIRDTAGTAERLLRAYSPNVGNDVTLRLVMTNADSPRLGERRRTVVGFAHDGRLANQRRYQRETAEPRFVYCDASDTDAARALYVTMSGNVLLAEDEDGNRRDDYRNRAFGCA